MSAAKVIFLDVDGCVLHHMGAGAVAQWGPTETTSTCAPSASRLCPGVIEKFNEWERAGHYVVLTTSRKECCRGDLERVLRGLGLFWDQLVMGLPHGERVLVNDTKRDGAPSARAIIVGRNQGLEELVL